MPGVVEFVDASDIPGMNSADGYFDREPIFASDAIGFAGQALGLIVADTYEHATEAAKRVVVTYKEVRTPKLTIQDALGSQRKSPPGRARQGTVKRSTAGKEKRPSLELGLVRGFPYDLESMLVPAIDSRSLYQEKSELHKEHL